MSEKWRYKIKGEVNLLNFQNQQDHGMDIKLHLGRKRRFSQPRGQRPRRDSKTGSDRITAPTIHSGLYLVYSEWIDISEIILNVPKCQIIVFITVINICTGFCFISLVCSSYDNRPEAGPDNQRTRRMNSSLNHRAVYETKNITVSLPFVRSCSSFMFSARFWKVSRPRISCQRVLQEEVKNFVLQLELEITYDSLYKLLS